MIKNLLNKKKVLAAVSFLFTEIIVSCVNEIVKSHAHTMTPED